MFEKEPEHAMEPIVSVIVPVYNCVDYLPECLSSIEGQTLREVEVVCIDDGSTDESAAIAEDFAARDDRFVVVRQENRGAAAARNAGIDRARGTYLYMIDCDDFADERLLEHAVARAEEAQADVVLLPFYAYDMRVKASVAPGWNNPRERFPHDPFTWRDNPDWLFQTALNYPWNKLVRRSFADGCGLRFSDFHLTEDLSFSGPAVVRASRMAVLDERLVYHREGEAGTLMGSKDRWPFDFYEAFREFRRFLEAEGVWDDLFVSYANWAANACLYNLETLARPETFAQVWDLLASEGLANLGIAGINRAIIRDDAERALLAAIEDGCAPLDYAYARFGAKRSECDELHNRLGASYRETHEARVERDEARRERDDARRERDEARAALAALQAEHDAQMNAAEQKIGRAICALPRAIQRRTLKDR